MGTNGGVHRGDLLGGDVDGTRLVPGGKHGALLSQRDDDSVTSHLMQPPHCHLRVVNTPQPRFGEELSLQGRPRYRC